MYNLNTSYGFLEAELMGAGQAGKTFVVAAGTSDLYNKTIQAFIPDADGTLRTFTTVQGAVDAAAVYDNSRIYLMPGVYNETVTIARNNAGLEIVGLGARQSASIAPSTAAAKALIVNADNVKLVNLDLAGNTTATYAARITGNGCTAIGCKFEGVDTSGSALNFGPGSVAQVNAGTAGHGGDLKLIDCEFAFSLNGFELVASDYGAATQILMKDCNMNNISGTEILGTPGAFGIGSTRNLHVIDNVFGRMEDGTKPSDFVNVNDASDTGLFSGNHFAIATNAAADIKVGAKVLYAANATEAGYSTARPA